MGIPDELARREERLIEAHAKERFEQEKTGYEPKLAARKAATQTSWRTITNLLYVTFVTLTLAAAAATTYLRPIHRIGGDRRCVWTLRLSLSGPA